MEHVGIDLGARHSHIVVVSEAGEVMGRSRVETSSLPRWLKKRSHSRVVMEACTQSPAIARASLAAGHETKVVPGMMVRALGVGARGIKTDDRDAEVLARASHRIAELPSVHLRSDLSRKRRELTSARASLLEARKAIALNVRSWLRGRLVLIRGRADTPSFAVAVRRAAREHEEGLPASIEVLLTTFEHLCTQIEQLGRSIDEIAEQDPICARLMQIPGVGPQISLAFVTYVDEPTRFESAKQLASYLALIPGESTTGGKIMRTSTIKAGPRYLKALLVQGAWSMWRSHPNDPIVLWARNIADKRGVRIGIVALARKLATVMWAMWKSGSAYDPSRASTVRTLQSSPQLLPS